MRISLKNILVVSSLVWFGTACDDFKFGNSFLEKPISDEMNLDSVFAKKEYAEQQLNNVYHSLPDFMAIDGRLGWSILESVTDLADIYKDGGSDYHNATLTSSSTAMVYKMDYGRADGKFSAVNGIRQAYIFINNVDKVPDMTQEEKEIRKAEAKMIIAYHYTDMLRHYGGMPWIDHYYKPDDDMVATRMTIEQTVDTLCTLLDDVAHVLPWKVAAKDDGRMTAAGALALKSRILTFVASPLFNSDQPYRGGEASDLHYTWWGNYDVQRWQRALDAGLEFLRRNRDEGEVYNLVDNGNPRESFKKGFFERYSLETLISSHRWEKIDMNSYALSQLRFGNGFPVLNYVDMFQMKTGEDFSWDNPVHRKHPFYDADFNELRDPRLYETFIVTGDKCMGHKAQIYPGGSEQPGQFGSATQWRFGDSGHTGIAVRKIYQDYLNELQNTNYQCPLMRLPEVYLNIAEAMNELGLATTKDEFGRDAYDYINLVRSRVDMPPTTPEKYPSGDALTDEILNERAREFGYEEVRYFDIVRRKRIDIWRRPLSMFISYPVKGSEYKGSKAGYQGEYTEFTYEILTGKEAVKAERLWVKEGIWDSKYFLTPIPLEEINKKYGLVQNPGWE